MGIGDWGLGIGDWAQSPIPNPQQKFNNNLNNNYLSNKNIIKNIINYLLIISNYKYK